MNASFFGRMVVVVLACTALFFSFTYGVAPRGATADSRMGNAYRLPERNGWTFVHLEGSPAEIGYQHGMLLAEEIADVRRVAALELQHDTGLNWSFFRREAELMMWPHIEQQYREELQGITEGLRAHIDAARKLQAGPTAGKETPTSEARMDLWDVVALNGWEEWEYYTERYARNHPDTAVRTATVPEHCSAFVATGRYTSDGKPVIGHNNWSNYMDGVRWTIIFDIAPAAGHRMLMDGLPGIIASDDDFGINDAGMMITETTISKFKGYDTTGIPEFVRARKAMQFATSIDEYAAIMKEGNNGGYANDWLIADRKTGEVASLELGLKNVTLQRTRDGYFVGANFPIDSALTCQETTYDPKDTTQGNCTRHTRWVQLMEEYKGRIDAGAARRFLADHRDVLTGQDIPSERTLCGHIDASPRGMGTWQPPYGTAGSVQNKVADDAMAARMSFEAAAGHACGAGFSAAAHLEAHPEFGWEKAMLRDMPARPWTVFASGR